MVILVVVAVNLYQKYGRTAFDGGYSDGDGDIGESAGTSRWKGRGARLPSRQDRRQRASDVEVAAEEALTDDPAFAPEAVKASTLELHTAIFVAWNTEDRAALRALLAPDLAVEWERRLDDFDRKGWHNECEVVGSVEVEYLGLVNRTGDAEDRVTVRIETQLRDIVRDRAGVVITRNDDDNRDELVPQTEYWTLGKHDGGWILLSIEQDAEGAHHLEAPIIASPWEDDRLHDEAVTEQATAAAIPDAQVKEVADLDFDGTARTAALDLANMDGRFAPDVLEAAARRALDAWAEAVDGDDTALDAIATPEAVSELLHPGDPSGKTRLVVRGPQLKKLRIVALDAAAEPPAMTVEADVAGRRYIQDRDTTNVLSGSMDREVVFTERWRMVLDGTDDTPWKIAS
jgi:predicted lipid-binding transport protein (Tim44 family)